MEPINDIMISTIIAHFIRYYSSNMLNLTKGVLHNRPWQESHYGKL